MVGSIKVRQPFKSSFFSNIFSIIRKFKLNMKFFSFYNFHKFIFCSREILLPKIITRMSNRAIIQSAARAVPISKFTAILAAVGSRAKNEPEIVRSDENRLQRSSMLKRIRKRRRNRRIQSRKHNRSRFWGAERTQFQIWRFRSRPTRVTFSKNSPKILEISPKISQKSLKIPEIVRKSPKLSESPWNSSKFPEIPEIS